MIKRAANGFVKSYLEQPSKQRTQRRLWCTGSWAHIWVLKHGRGEVCAHEPPSNGTLGRDLGWVLWPCLSCILDKGQGVGGVTKLGYL